jgi:hypothetical protein
VPFLFVFVLSIVSLCAYVHAHSHYDPRPALQAAQKRAAAGGVAEIPVGRRQGGGKSPGGGPPPSRLTPPRQRSCLRQDSDAAFGSGRAVVALLAS